MVETIISFAIAIVAGTIAGLLPGLNVFTTLLVLYPYLITIDPVNMIMIYIVFVVWINTLGLSLEHFLQYQDQ